MEQVIAIILTNVAIALFFYRIGKRAGPEAKTTAANPFGNIPPAPAPIIPILFVPPVAIGAHFTYLGLDMLCLGHEVFFGGLALPGIRAEYVADDGAMRSWSFTAMDMEAFRAEIGRGHVADGVAP